MNREPRNKASVVLRKAISIVCSLALAFALVPAISFVQSNTPQAEAAGCAAPDLALYDIGGSAAATLNGDYGASRRVVIVGRPGCWNTKNTVSQALELGENSSYSDINFLVLDVDDGSGDFVTGFAGMTTSRVHFFSPLSGSGVSYNSWAWDIYREFSASTPSSVTLPFAVFIDESNTAVNVTTGYHNLENLIKESFGVSDNPSSGDSSASEYTDITVTGTLSTELQNAVNRLNEIRKEACDEGINGLTAADYVPLQWSYDMEQIARVRAVEASTARGHVRPNGSSCFTATADSGNQSYGENLAWNTSGGLMAGIELWYAEKSDLLNNTGNTTGHYEIMINMKYTSFAVVAFKSDTGWYPWIIAGEFSYYTSSAENVAVSEDVSQQVQVQTSELSGSISGSETCVAGNTANYEFQLKLNRNVDGVQYSTGPYAANSSVEWSSSDTNVATIRNGVLTALKPGTVVITARDASGFSATKSVKVSGNISACDIDSITNQMYTGSAIEPPVAVRNAAGDELEEGADYTVSYSNNLDPGLASIKVVGIGSYTGTLTGNFAIYPAKPSISYLWKGKKSFDVWAGYQGSITGYQVAYKQSGGTWVTKTYKGNTISKKIKKLQKGKRYTVKVRAYKTTSIGTLYGSWSKSKSVKVK